MNEVMTCREWLFERFCIQLAGNSHPNYELALSVEDVMRKSSQILEYMNYTHEERATWQR
jgi:hypothetical protein